MQQLGNSTHGGKLLGGSQRESMLCERDELPLQFYPSLRRSCKLTGKVARQGVCSACPESTDHRAPVRPSGLVIDSTGQGLHIAMKNMKAFYIGLKCGDPIKDCHYEGDRKLRWCQLFGDILITFVPGWRLSFPDEHPVVVTLSCSVSKYREASVTLSISRSRQGEAFRLRCEEILSASTQF